MSLTSPKLTMSLLLPVALVVVVVSGLLEATLFATVMLELDSKVSLSLTQAVVTPAAEVDLPLLEEFAATVVSLLVAKLPGLLVA